MLKNIFTMVGIYSTISTTWRSYELIRYGRVTPKDKDAVIAMLLAILIYLLIV